MNLKLMVKSAGKSIIRFGSEKSNVISGVAAIGGVVLTAVLAYKARPKADRIIFDQKEKLDELEEVVNIPEEEMKRCKREITVETVKRLVPVLGPAVMSGVATCGLMGFSIISGEKKIASMTALAAISETAYKELYDKTKEIVGEEKAEEIRVKALEEAAKKTNPEIAKEEEDNDVKEIDDFILQAAGGNQLFYDPSTGRVFKSDVDTITRACDTLTRRIKNGMEPYFTYNEFYREILLPSIFFGEEFGWGNLTSQDEISPNLNNTIKIGKRSALVLDWYYRPTTMFRTERKDFKY